MYRVRLIDFPDHLVVNWAYSSRRLPRSSRRDQTCRHRVRLVDSWDRLITHHSVQSSSRRTLGSSRRELISRDWDQIVRATWKMEELRGMLENAINKIEAISSTPTPNDNNNNNPRGEAIIQHFSIYKSILQLTKGLRLSSDAEIEECSYKYWSVELSPHLQFASALEVTGIELVDRGLLLLLSLIWCRCWRYGFDFVYSVQERGFASNFQR